jgi:H+/Cl- antiporter ClcA
MTSMNSETASTLRSTTGAGSSRADDETPVTPAQPVHPYVHVVVVAVIGAVVVLAWLWVYHTLNALIWENSVVIANRWLFPVICLPLSLLVGLLVKYRHAPTNLDESMIDSLTGDVTKINWRTLPIATIAPLVSLLAGAVIGPEGGIGGIAVRLAAFYNDKVGIPVSHRAELVFSTAASAYNGLIANPLFTGVLGTELIRDPEERSRTLPANLIGGSIGYLIFFAVGYSGLDNYFHLTETQPLTYIDVPIVIACAMLGLILALVAGILFRASAAVFGRFKGREVERALAAGVVFSLVGVFAPIVLFSGETQIQTVVANPAAYGPFLLVVMAFVKLALLAVAFKSGFLGGPTFPSIFASVCLALAISLLLPGIRSDVLMAGLMAGFLVVLFKAPFMVILLTVVMLQASPELTALIVLAVAAVMIVQPYILAALAARQAARAARRGPAPG